MLSKQNKRYYLKPMSESEMDGFREAVATENALFHMWKKGDEDILKMNFSQLTDEEIIFQVEKQDFEIIKLMASELILLKLTNEEDQFFTHGRIAMNEQLLTVHFKLGRQVLKNIQRQNCRINTSDSVKVSINVDGNAYKCLDVSAGGSCFITEDESLFEKDTEVKDAILKFKGQDFKIPTMKIAMCKEKHDEVLGKTTYMVGVQFLDLSYSVEDEIWVLVNKEMKRIMEIEKIVDERKAS